MKRILCVTLALLLLFPILLLPAAAAEPEEYVFEYVEPLALMSDDYDFDAYGSYYRCSSLIPEGYYRLQVILEDKYLSPVFYFTPAPLVPGEPGGTYNSESYFSPVLFPEVVSLSFDGNLLRNKNVSFEYYSSVFVMSAGSKYYSTISFLRNEGSSTFFLSNAVVSMISVDIISENLSGSLSSEPYAAFSEILSLLPIVLPVVVSFIAIRKAISYVRSKVNGS